MERRRVQLICDDVSRTKQEFKKDCDMNFIMKRFKKVVGADFLETYNSYVDGRFKDVSSVPDYRTALDIVKRSEATFGALPAKVRSRFQNDAAQFLDFVSDPKNLEEMKALGLTKIEPKKPVEVAPNPA